VECLVGGESAGMGMEGGGLGAGGLGSLNELGEGLYDGLGISLSRLLDLVLSGPRLELILGGLEIGSEGVGNDHLLESVGEFLGGSLGLGAFLIVIRLDFIRIGDLDDLGGAVLGGGDGLLVVTELLEGLLSLGTEFFEAVNETGVGDSQLCGGLFEGDLQKLEVLHVLGIGLLLVLATLHEGGEGGSESESDAASRYHLRM